MNFRDVFWGVILLVIGIFFAVRDLTDIDLRGYFWPLLMITAGVLLLFKSRLNDYY